jgi:hypothetical protein
MEETLVSSSRRTINVVTNPVLRSHSWTSSLGLLTVCQIPLHLVSNIRPNRRLYRVKLQLDYLPTAFKYYTIGKELGMNYVLYTTISALVIDKRGFSFLVETSGGTCRDELQHLPTQSPPRQGLDQLASRVKYC